ncbi:UvrD-helicase domain-containing protein [Rhodococcus sp. BP-149]|uniref:UvrD-helicase domain-containing protein n=1 Tax=unclassified Rhodococcus (in: high G+C Gram-positive bacteria) TaxID=192944 RepID=UPI001C9BB79C|nr:MULTISPECIES: UvrD-helicase domain-containing protein [unclassified Rhodococcus (in: high G+C Gram-positive bacteria)]MBY6687231.1 UvrD-helicase domain-containing protein [Rhodococcus sp. BP-288]MBY6694346.1 UvrD-helicase domain-containing protein [Rhodococcus sp. BP-188]MBY6698055.1 UvrD-helicase domain-containing protein [Rhodococcus sp. BP-285]MBY6704275.1 UvrD-helicase domain-containing protein [Rhodococcus sp. BP-283]MBY6712924.1 UvrD-helicase domain-containing protein [Rhodococcus sp.
MISRDLVDSTERDRIESDTAATLFVEAGAGSGKTHSLVRRICHLVLEDGIELDRIAAITFTEKAAAELRERVRVELAKHTGGLAERALLQVDTAAIGTLHAFAARIVSEHPLEAGVPPRLQVVDAMGSQLSFERRWRRIQSHLFGDSSTTPAELADAMKVIVASGASLDQVRTFADALDRSWDRLVVAEVAPVMAIPDIDDLLRQADLVVDNKSACSDPDDKLVLHLDKVAAWRKDLADSRGSAGWLAVALLCPSSGRGGRAGSWGGGMQAVKDLINNLKASASEVRTRYVSSAIEVLLHHLAVVIVDEAAHRRREGRLEFHDLLVYARDVLENSDVQAAVHAAYQRVMLDEFQDTDPLQLELARLIVDGKPGRLFTVGDPKQSIYRFRRADIAAYMAARDLAGDGIATLSTNFRSTKAVLDWINEVFGRAIVADGHVQPSYTPLDPAPGRPAWTSDTGPKPFVFMDPTTPVDSEELMTKSNALRAREARDVAKIIYTATTEGWQKEVGGYGAYTHEPIMLRDICILIPSRGVLPYLEKSLDNAGIEFRSEASSLVYSTQEVHDLLLACRALANTADEAALVAALRTPLFGCGDDDLLRWKSADGRWNWFGDAPAGLEESPVAHALAYFKAVWFDLGTMNPGALLSRVATDRRVFEVSMDSPRHRDVWRRLRFVIDQAHAWYDDDRGNLRDYLDWAATQSEEDARVAEAVLPEIGVNAVRIMTIHAAKGLQFPFVIVAGMSGGFRQGSEAVIWDDDGELHANIGAATQTVGFSAANVVEKKHTEAERIRLLYVACTRAESLLAFSGYAPTGRAWGKVLDIADSGSPALLDVVRIEDRGSSETGESEAWDQWQAISARVKETSSIVASMSPTTIAHAATDVAREVLAGYRDHSFTVRASAEIVPPSVGAVDHGPELGVVLHALMEAVELTDPDYEVKARAAASLAGLEDPDRFVLLAQSALESEPVRRAAESEHWREVPLIGLAPDGRTVVDGIADLVYRDTSGGLVIADYKTDVGVTDLTIAEYWVQLAIYASLLGKAVGDEVCRLELIFCRPGGATVISRERATAR